MKAHLFCLALCLISGFITAQTGSNPKNDLELHRITGAANQPSSLKMPCDASNTLSITSCEGETPSNGDNDPSDGAFMNWSVTGSGLYYFVIYTVVDTFEIINSGVGSLPNQTVFFPNQTDGTSFDGGLITGVEGAFDCIPQGIYTIQAWSVQDLDVDGRPDRDFNGDIIGCYEECVYDFRPSCARPNELFLTIDARDIGCNGSGGSIELSGFRTDNFYCVDVDGTGARANWVGPNGFTSTEFFIDDLEPGVYSVEVMDIYDCTAIWDINITELDNVAFACEVISTPSTVGGTDGSARINIIAGLGNYVLSWTGPVSGSTTSALNGITEIDNLPAGDYVFTLLDTRSTCTEDCLLTIPGLSCDTPVAGVVDRQNSDCDGNLNGRIEIEFSGNFNPVLVWSGPGVDGASSPILENLGPGTYTYTVTDDRLCTATGNVTIRSEPSFTFSCGGVDETLPFLDDGRIGLELLGGSPAFSLSYVAVNQAGDTLSQVNDQPVANGDTLRNLPAATYFLEVTDQTGCTRSCVATVSEPNCDIFPNCVPENPVSIFGNGRVTLNFDGGSVWFVTVSGAKDTTFVTPVPTVVLDSLPQGDYTVSVYNSEGCTGGCSFSIVPPPCTLAATLTSRQPSCFGESDGRIILEITGESEGLTVDWNDDAYDGLWVAENLPPGDYAITISDRTGCPVEPFRVTLSEPAALVVDLEEVRPITCFEDADGAIRANVSGGVGAYRFAWSVPAPASTTQLDNLAAGSYFATVTDSSGCTAEASIRLRQPVLLSMECSATAETLLNSMDGTVSVANAGAEGVVTLSGDLGTVRLTANSDTTFTNLSPGTYDLVITDARGCTTSCQAIVNPGPCMISLSTTTVQPDCDNARGSATAVPSNPFGTVTYRWSNGAEDATLTNLAPGLYTVTATDASGCQATSRAFITAFTDIPAVTDARVSEVCDDGCTDLRLTLEGTPPFTISYAYQQNNGPERFGTLTMAGSGVQSFCPTDLGFADLSGVTLRLIHVADGNGCTRRVSRVLPVTRFAPAIGLVDTTICPGGRVNILGEVFDASRAADQIVLPLASVNGCDSTVNVAVSFFAPAFSALDTLLCPGEQLPLFGQLFNANRRTGAVVVPTPAASGCDSTIFVTVGFHEPLDGRLDTTLCRGERFNFFGEVFSENRTTGRVTVPTPNVNGCDSSVVVAVEFYPEATGVLDTLICAGTRLNYYGRFFDENRTSGEVRLPIASANGCDTTVSVTVGFYPEVIGVFDTTICEGERFQYGDVLFEGAANNVLVLLDEPNQFGCDSLVFTTVRTQPLPRVTLAGDGVICPGGMVEIQLIYDGTDPASVVLSSDPNERIDLLAGRTTLERQVPAGTTISILDIVGGGVCPTVGTGELLVTESDLAVGIEVQSGTGTFDLDCADSTDGELLAVISGGLGPYNYNWSTGRTSANLRNLPAGDYALEVTSARGCLVQAAVTLTAPPPIESQLLPRAPNCIDSLPDVRLVEVTGGVGPYLFRANENDAFQPVAGLPLTIDLPLGFSALEIEDANGCRQLSPFRFRPLPPEEIRISPLRTVIPEGDSVYIQVSTTLDAVGYSLSPGTEELREVADFFVSPNETTRYQLTAVDSIGCEVVGAFEVIIDNFVPIYAPNVFTPNGDGNNDLFRLYARRTVLAFNSFSVFSRWGEQVYELREPVSSQDPNWGWDGRTRSGQIYEQDVYVFKAEVVLSGGRVVEVTGDVLLMRN